MTLPKRPECSAPIPNQPFDSPEVTTVKGPYWDMPLGSGLEDDGQGSVQTSGSDPSAPTAYLYGSSGFVGLGAGLQLGPNGEVEQGGGYIYCTPAYPELPVTYPPYGCNAEVNTAGVTDFSYAWFNCQELTEFDCVDSSAVTDFSYAWNFCYQLTSFPPINTSLGENFSYSWSYTSLTSFPRLNTSSGLDFYYAWGGCYFLTSFPSLDTKNGTDFSYTWRYCEDLSSFPVLDLSSGELFYGTWEHCSSLISFPPLNLSEGTDFTIAWQNCYSLVTLHPIDVKSGVSFYCSWQNCTSLTSFPLLDFSSGVNFTAAWSNCSSLVTFPSGGFDNCPANQFGGAWYNCSLLQQSVDNILVSLDTAGQTDGVVNLDGGTSSAPGAAGLAAKAALQARGWTVLTN